jgi:membrane-bound serine protease (ClpP class)
MQRALLFFVSVCVLLPLTTPAVGATVAVIEIRSEISKGLERYIGRALDEAEESADLVVFDMHTPGGRVDVMGDVINHIFESDLPTIAHVRTEAISAGAIIALASDQIVMAPGGTIGDAAPVDQSGTELGEKAVSYIRGKIRATAERNGRNPDIAEAMVDKRKILVVGDGPAEALTSAERAARRKAGEEFTVLSPRGELLTLTTGEAMDLGFVELRAADLDELLAAYTLVELDGSRAVMTADQLADAQASGVDLVIVEGLADATVIRLNRSMAETLAIAVTSSILGSLLMSVGMLGIFIEFRTPGFGVPGVLGLTCMALFFGGHMIADVSASVGLLLFAGGVVLLALEAFVIPGFGIAGFLGIALSLGGLFFTFASGALTMSDAMASFSIAVFTTLVLAVAALFALPKTRAWNRLVLDTAQSAGTGYLSARPELGSLLGQTGLALTMLRPSGSARIGGKRIDVVSDSEYVSKDTPVEVVHVEGGRVVVRPQVDETAGDSAT